jgi:hypothetical protein
MAGARKQKGKVAQKKKTGAGEDKAIVVSFTIPPVEHKPLTDLKAKCIREKSVYITKSEIIRVGLQMVGGLSASEFLKRWQKLTKLSPGRPRKSEE